MSEKAVTAPNGSKPFSAYERMIAWRYLRARRKETFISVIAGFSFTGIMLGVATLIIVMAVMNGFRAELLTRILGINGHVIMQPMDRPFDDYDAVIKRVDAVPGVSFAIPVVEGQVLAKGNVGAGAGALVRGLREEDIAKLQLVSKNVRQGTFQGFNTAGGVAIGTRMAENMGLGLGDKLTLISPDGAKLRSAPIGALTNMTQRQFRTLTSTPPMMTPKAAAIAPDAAQKEIARSRPVPLG